MDKEQAVAELGAIAEDLGSLMTRVNVLENWLSEQPDTPPPVGDSVLFRGLFWYTPDVPPDALLYTDFVLQRSATTADQLDSLPGVHNVHMYAGPVSQRLSDPNGWTASLPPAMVKDSWLYKTRTGGKIARTKWIGTEYFINPGNAEYIASVAAYLPPKLKALGVNGVMWDEINEDPTWTFPQASGQVTKAQHQADLLKFLDGVRPAFQALGLRTMVNLGANLWPLSATSFARQVVDRVDEVWLEQFIGRQLSGFQPPATIGDMWDYQVPFLNQLRMENRAFTVNVAHADQAVIDYALVSYLLVAHDYSTFVSQPGGNGTPAHPSQSLLDRIERLGEPTEPPVFNLASGQASRNFRGGRVTVYPTPAAWRNWSIG